MKDPALTDVLARLRAIIPRGGREAAAKELGISTSYVVALLTGHKVNPSSEVRRRLQAFADRHGAFTVRSAPGVGRTMMSPTRAKIEGLLDNIDDDEAALDDVLNFVRHLVATRWMGAAGNGKDAPPEG